ncbi:Diaminopimelate epimerase [Buchnera aphidicola (Cinara cuneomaculata)]|uniref:Diaminopimelate epimerase n=1 Tax=Buchnera aphidicola (Cinara cuneomaculata) TaxID=1660040 RepID=A0A451CYD2_9GAMM|nr:Diaminopimelate epimerase [Buchnera aphidicola (Cinara cuneomaculata)]
MFLKKNIIFFSKMHGLGNDFILIDSSKNNFFFSSELIKQWSNRHLGVGFDQLLVLQSSQGRPADFHYRIFNSNGIEVEQCGNGARCIAYYLFIIKKIDKKKICVSTKNRYLFLEHIYKNIFKVDMGRPIFIPSQIPFTHTMNKIHYSVIIDKKKYVFSVVSMGNPHCVIQVDDLKNFKVNDIGLKLSQHILFPQGVNVGFMQILSKKKILLRVYERHVGETKACGSGACAAVAIGIRNSILDNHVTVILQQGILKIDWTGVLKNHLYMSGEAHHIYDGVINY